MNDDREIRGYQPIYAPRPDFAVTQAFINCERCGGVVSSTMGPRPGALCVPCVRAALQTPTYTQEGIDAAKLRAREMSEKLQTPTKESQPRKLTPEQRGELRQLLMPALPYDADLSALFERIESLLEGQSIAAPALPKEPSPGLLMSMSIRYDHALGCPGYYDNALFSSSKTGHADHLRTTLTVMRQLYEEVSGHGFYSPDKEAEYAALAPPTPPSDHSKD